MDLFGRCLQMLLFFEWSSDQFVDFVNKVLLVHSFLRSRRPGLGGRNFELWAALVIKTMPGRAGSYSSGNWCEEFRKPVEVDHGRGEAKQVREANMVLDSLQLWVHNSYYAEA